MSNAEYELPNISVDVVPVRLNTTNELEIIVGRRIYEPYLNEFALPGVLLTPHERLNEAAERALESKTLLQKTDIISIVDLGTFDNPDRDPRGATVSIAKLAIISPDAKLDDTRVTAYKADDLVKNTIKLPFDHNSIVRAAVNLFGEKFLSSRQFTHAVLGDTFVTKTVRSLLQQMKNINTDMDHTYDLSNLTRQLKSTGWVSVVDDSTSSVYKTNTSRGRPSRVWTWEN